MLIATRKALGEVSLDSLRTHRIGLNLLRISAIFVTTCLALTNEGTNDRRSSIRLRSFKGPPIEIEHIPSDSQRRRWITLKVIGSSANFVAGETCSLS